MRINTISVAILAIAAAAHAQTYRVDGLFDEWAGATPVATDPAGDNSGAFDLTELFAASRGDVLYLCWDTNAMVNLQAGSSSNGHIRLDIGFSDGDSLTIDFRDLEAYENGSPGNGVSWNAINYTTMPTAALPRYETQLDLGDYITGLGDTITIDFSGTDSLDSGPVIFVMNDAAQPEIERDTAEEPGTDFRIFNLNTLTSGFLQAGQKDQIGRLVDAMDPHIVCLQEEYDPTAAQIKARLEEIDPRDDGAPWTVHLGYDHAVASPFPLIPYNGPTSDRFTAAVVDLPGGAVFVFSVHTKCCGYAGSSEDAQRIFQTQEMIDVIDAFRAGTLQGTLDAYADAPVVVIGDWNHVGSNIPLEMMLDPGGPAQTHLYVPHLVGERIFTWRDFDGFGFSPGLLDLVTYDDPELTPKNHFVLDTTKMSGATLAALGLQANDSNVSDHLPIIVDFSFDSAPVACSEADLTTQGAGIGDPLFGVPDGLMTGADLQFYVNAWVAFDLVIADVTTQGAGAGDPGFGVPDGLVTGADIQYYVNLWVAGCP